MQKKALVIIDIQNDITKNYKDIIGNVNRAIEWAVKHDVHVVYVRLKIYQMAQGHLSLTRMELNWFQT